MENYAAEALQMLYKRPARVANARYEELTTRGSGVWEVRSREATDSGRNSNTLIPLFVQATTYWKLNMMYEKRVKIYSFHPSAFLHTFENAFGKKCNL